MSEEQAEEQVTGFGVYNPEASGHQPYNDAMAAWRNQVTAMQEAGELPGNPVAEDAEESNSVRRNRQSVEELEERQGSEEPAERSVDEAPDPTPDGTSKEDREPQEDADGPKDEDSEDEGPDEVFDPAEHNTAAVLAYLGDADLDEATRVLESEEHGKARKGILNTKDDLLVRKRLEAAEKQDTPSE